MSWLRNWIDTYLLRRKVQRTEDGTVIIDLPADLYYRELAIYTAKSLIGNAISRSEIRVFENGKPIKNRDYYLLNVSPNANETSSVFWQKAINKMTEENEALIVEVGERLYLADSFTVERKNTIYGDVYSGVTVRGYTFDKIFTQQDAYLLKLNDVSIKTLLDGAYDSFGTIIASAAKAFKKANGQKYKLRINEVQAGNKDFEDKFQKMIDESLKPYLENDNAIYPEFEGYLLEPDKNMNSRTSEDFRKLKEDWFRTVSMAFHIPESIMTGNITNMAEVVEAFLSFGVNPYGDVITEALNKRGGLDNFLKGNYYKLDTSNINHKDIFKIASGIASLVSSGVFSIDDVLLELGREPLGESWSSAHYITKNFSEINQFLTSAEGGE